MNRLTAFVLGAGLALASIGIAYADDSVTGAWKLTVGANATPCTLTLSPDTTGTAGAIASNGTNCPSGLYGVTAWKLEGNGIQLYAGTGDLVAWLKPSGANYVGTRFADGRKLALSR